MLDLICGYYTIDYSRMYTKYLLSFDYSRMENNSSRVCQADALFISAVERDCPTVTEWSALETDSPVRASRMWSPRASGTVYQGKDVKSRENGKAVRFPETAPAVVTRTGERLGDAQK